MDKIKINIKSELVEDVHIASHCQKILLKYRNELARDVILVSEDGLSR